MPRLRHLLALGAVSASVLVGTGTTGTPAGAVTGPRHVPAPARMAVLGDSISRAFDTTAALQDSPGLSWSTGDAPQVASHATRLRALSPGLVAANDAVTGATSALLPAQAAAAVAQGADYVEVLIGANDACRPTVAQMTPVAEFRANVAAAFAELRGARVFVASVPDVRRVWSVGKDVPAARQVWSDFGLCQSMLADPLSTARPDRERRAAVRRRIQAYNDVLREECAALPACRTDHGAVFKAHYTLDLLSPIDFYHPSVLGQAVLSETTWAQTWRFQPVG